MNNEISAMRIHDHQPQMRQLYTERVFWQKLAEVTTSAIEEQTSEIMERVVEEDEWDPAAE